jgi:transposase
MEDLKKNLLKYVNEGLTNIEIGEIYKVSRNTISRWLKKYELKRVKTHPYLNENFFEKIDNKDKAYWFGYLCADGYITKNGYKLVLDLKKTDFELLLKFCNDVGSDQSKITERTHKNGYKSNKLVIYNKKFVDHIKNNGCLNNKSLNLKFNNFNEETLDLAYLMGFYDGDGFANSSVVCSASIDFLKQIKIKYDIKYEITKKNNLFLLNLGANLKRKMMTNYPNSLERKRTTYKGDKLYKTKGINIERTKKFYVEKDVLSELIKNKSYVEIGKIFGVSDNAIKKRAKKLGIELKKKK